MTRLKDEKEGGENGARKGGRVEDLSSLSKSLADNMKLSGRDIVNITNFISLI